MTSINEEFSSIQLSLIAAQRDLERIDKPETTLEELHVFDGTLRSIQAEDAVVESQNRSVIKQTDMAAVLSSFSRDL